MRMSRHPRAFRSVKTFNQNFAPSVCSIQRPRISRVPSGNTASARYTALLRTVASSRIFTRSASKNTTGYIGSSGRLCHAVTSATTASVTALIKSGETSTAYISFRKALNLTHRHAPRIQGNHLVVEASNAPLMFANQLRLEAGLAITRHLNRYRTVVGENGLRTASVAMIGGELGLGLAGGAPEVIGQLCAQCPLDQGFLESARGAFDLRGRRWPSRTIWSRISAGIGARTSAPGYSDFGLRAISTPHAMPHTQEFGYLTLRFSTRNDPT